jgi:hypothetical protein
LAAEFGQNSSLMTDAAQQGKIPAQGKITMSESAWLARQREKQQRKDYAVALRELDFEVQRKLRELDFEVQRNFAQLELDREYPIEKIQPKRDSFFEEQSLPGNHLVGSGLKDFDEMLNQFPSRPQFRSSFRSSFPPIAEEFKDSHLHEKPSCARPPLSDPRNRNWSEEEFTDFFKAEEEKESKRKSHLRRIREVANMSASQSARAFKGSSFSSFKQSIMNFFVE